MSLSSVINRYPVAAGELLATMTLLSGMPGTHSNNKWTVVESAELAESAVFVLPLLDVALLQLPTSEELLDCDQLWLKLKGKSKMSQAAGDTTHELVCEIVGGAGLAGGKLGVGQMGVTFADVQHVLVPCDWVLLDAKAAGLYKVTAAPGATAGNTATVDNPALARGRDLDGNVWGCFDKRGAQIRLNKLISLTRLFTRIKMDTFVEDLIFDDEKLKDVCMMIRSTPGPAKPAEHPHAGLHLYPTLHSLAVMRGDFSAASKFQHAVLLHFSSLSHAKVSLLDFAEPKAANSIRFDKGRSTLAARGFLRSALEYVGVFFQCYSHQDFQDALLPLTRSLQLDTGLWAHFDDAYLLFRFSLMLQVFSEEVRQQKESTIVPNGSLKTGADCSAVMRALATKTVQDAVTGDDNWSRDGHYFHYARDVGQHWDIVPRPATDDEGLPLTAAPKRTSDGNVKSDPPADPSSGAGAKQEQAGKQEQAAKLEQAAATRAKQHCAHHLMHLLGVMDTDGKKAACTQPAGKCAYRHVQDLGSVTKAQALNCSRLRFRDKVLGDGFATAVAAKAEGSWKVAEMVDPEAKKRRIGGRGGGQNPK
jgi:hypothetical protein